MTGQATGYGADALACFATGFEDPSVTADQQRRRDSESVSPPLRIGPRDKRDGLIRVL